jgi:cytochrome c
MVITTGKIIIVTLLLSIGPAISNAWAGPEKRCLACHAFSDKNNIGPGLKGVFGRKAGTHPDFKYSDSLKSANWVWDEEHLRKWIYNAKDSIKAFTGDDTAKTKMPKYKIKGKKADKIINFLKKLK